MSIVRVRTRSNPPNYLMFGSDYPERPAPAGQRRRTRRNVSSANATASTTSTPIDSNQVSGS